MDDDNLKSYYDFDLPNQFAFDSNESVQMIDCIRCPTKEQPGTFRGEVWP